MPAKSPNATQNVLSFPSNASENTKCFSTCVDQTQPMPASTQNVSEHVLTISTMPTRTQNVSEHVLNKPIPFQRGHKMYLNMC
jgi:hypothetical protein